jgi:prepilin-type N-terminal cleavage/methylation domain-containing protein
MMALYRKEITRVGASGTIGSGFTLIELLVVIVIISILATISMTGIKSAREKARQTNCMSNLRQIGVALVTYRGDHSGGNPDWISNLYPSYIDDLSVYVCRSDTTRGHGLTPEGVDAGMRKYKNPIDNDCSSNPNSRNTDGTSGKQTSLVEANSYFYEFSNATCDFSTSQTWAEYKEWELREGNGGKPFSSSKLPIVRCFHHAPYSKVDSYPFQNSGVPNKNDRIERSGLTLNVAYAGNVTIAPLWWQGAVEIGDKD